ncbi:PIR Superfamily Protein [Plasmodium ovale wallikeri]|uniref:PIR Superfamily Protein n=1 Tax=Plasmodium ovale wallikeri TaxID=864142 RepID=A0A1A9AE97_PLAOA|nr:PIR Superfamily Protein [Plasmodium ovale wallikeri]
MSDAKEEEYYAIVSQLQGYKHDINNIMNTSFESIDHLCNNIINEEFDKNKNYINPCIGFIKYSHYLTPEDGNTEDRVQDCRGLNYWLKGEIKDVSGKKYNTLEFYNILKSKIKEDLYTINICQNEIKVINDSLFQNLQNISDLYANLNEYSTKYIVNDRTRCDKANSCVTTYDRIITPCNSQSNSAMCNSLKRFKNEYNMSLEHENNCPGLKTTLTYPEMEKTIVKRPSETVTHGVLDKNSMQHVEEESGTVSPGLTSSTFNIIITVFVSLALFKILFILYKFTTFRSLINNPVKSMKNMLRNKNEEKNEFSVFEQESANTNFVERRYSIAYNSS